MYVVRVLDSKGIGTRKHASDSLALGFGLG